jgi:hypothetical protein
MGFPSYKGHTNLGDIDRFMDLDAAEVGYFIEQVSLSAASFGVADADVTAVGMALNKLFGYKCSPPVAVLPNATAETQAICQAEDCALAGNAICAAYPMMGMPMSPANATMPSAIGAMSSAATMMPFGTGAANAVGAGIGSVAAVGGILALALAL